MQELISDITGAFIDVCSAHIFRKVFVQRNLMKRMRNRDDRYVGNEGIDEGRAVGSPTTYFLKFNSELFHSGQK
jgi:hypothetical protein